MFLTNTEISKLPEVTTSAPWENSKKVSYHKDGPFSEVIFGPRRDYKCQCGLLEGKTRTGMVCTVCGVKIQSVLARRKTLAKIKLHITIVNPLFMELFKMNYGEPIKKLILQSEKYILLDGRLVPDEKGKCGVQFFKSICHDIDWIKTDFKELVKNSMDSIFIDNIIIIPPALRPMFKEDEFFRSDKINSQYKTILNEIAALKDVVIKNITTDGDEIFLEKEKMIQIHAMDMYNIICDTLAKKEGLIRQHLLASRIDFSARSIIVPDYTLNMNECILPFETAKELFKFQLMERLTRKTNSSQYEIMNKIEEMEWSSDLRKELVKLVQTRRVILNRQPTLHRPSMQAFIIKGLTNTNVIKIHPLVCQGYNADFDGDTFAVYMPSTIKAVDKEVDTMMSINSMFSVANGELIMGLRQDMIIGLQSLTEESETPDENKLDGLPLIEKIKQHGPIAISQNSDYHILNKSINIYKHKTTFGRLIFNFIYFDGVIEEDSYINEVLNKKKFDKLCIQYYERHFELKNKLGEMLDIMSKVTFEVARISPISLSLDDFKLDSVKKMDDFEGKDNNEIKRLLEEEVEDITNEFKRKNGNINKIVGSGARGSMDQCKQIAARRGFISDANGSIYNTPILNNLLNGLSDREMFMSSVGGRKGIMDKALNTATTGYLARILSFVANQVELTIDDCKTDRYVKIKVTKELLTSLKGRYHMVNGIAKLVDESCLDKDIDLRSIFGCKDVVCKICYGDSHKISNSRYVGIIAAQTLSEPATQLVMRTFHTAGASNTTSIEIPDSCYLDGIFIHCKQNCELITSKDKYQLMVGLDIIAEFNKSDVNPISDLDIIAKDSVVFSINDDNNDIVNAMAEINKILQKTVVIQNLNDSFVTVVDLFKLYLENGIKIWLNHFEIIMYQQLYYFSSGIYTKIEYSNWDPDTKEEIQFVRIKEVPHLQSPTLGLAFEDIKKSLKNIATTKPTKKPCVLERFMK